MKRIMFYALVLTLGLDNAFAEESELFPLSDIVLGMSFKELLEKHPTDKILGALDFGDRPNIKKEREDNYLIFYDIHSNRFWDVLAVQIENSKVESLRYFYANREVAPPKRDHSKMVKNIKPAFKQLTNQLGSEFEKRIVCDEVKSRCAMYVWKREKDVVAFSHAPVSKYKQGEKFVCSLLVTPTVEILEKLSTMATDSLPEDVKLWADAMDE